MSFWIKEIFKVNFNREGFCLNVRNSSPYDLTRMQPQAYWYKNHLLMRIKYDTFQILSLHKAIWSEQKSWDTLKGALEIQEETMILTTPPYDMGLVRIKGNQEVADAKVSVRLKGNKAGSQVIYLRADTNLNRYVSVELTNNYLYVTERDGGPRKILFKLNLNEHDGIPPVSIPEDKKAAEIRALETFVRYATSAETAKIYAERLKDKELEKVPSVADGAEEYIPVISRHDKGDRLLTISIKGNKIGATVDGKEAVKDLAVTNVKGGAFFLEFRPGSLGLESKKSV